MHDRGNSGGDELVRDEYRTGQDRTGGQDRSGQVRTGQDNTVDAVCLQSVGLRCSR